MITRPLCKTCQRNPCKTNGFSKSGEQKYSSICSQCQKRKYPGSANRKGNRKRQKYRKHLGQKCERCGFVPEDTCQLDMHHKNKNHNDNSITNLETLCANCHRVVHKKMAEIAQ